MFIDEPTVDSPVTESQDVAEATPEVQEVVEETPEESKDWEAEAKKWQAIAKRHEKKQNAPEPAADISTLDVLYLSKADIEAADVPEVIEYAKKMGVSLQDAHNFYKPILKERSEERRTAQATQTKSPRGTTKVSGDELLRKAERTNALPDSDDQATELFLARRSRQFRQYDK